MNQKGFTLIELLVVVLIIGILSSVALPQYQKTVLKSRAAEAWSTLAAIRTAVNAYCLENPSGSMLWSTGKEHLSIEIADSKNFTYDGFFSCLAPGPHGDVFANYSKGSTTFKLSLNRYGQRVCTGGTGCKDLGFKDTGTGQTCASSGGSSSSTCYYMD